MAEQEWSRIEVEAIVSDYFDMLLKELAGITYSKAAHRRSLIEKLQNRSEGAVEYKHQNISAVMIEYGQPYISGYKPLWNYQKLVEDTVKTKLDSDDSINKYSIKYLETALQGLPSLSDRLDIEVEKPIIHSNIDRVKTFSSTMKNQNYYEKEIRNRLIELRGEQFIIQYEIRRLSRINRKDLASKVEHISRTRGDGAGYDVLSFTKNGEERYLEVKTTLMGQDAPFYFTRNELDFSKKIKTNIAFVDSLTLKIIPAFSG